MMKHTQANIFFKPQQIRVNGMSVKKKKKNSPDILFQSEIKTELTHYFCV